MEMHIVWVFLKLVFLLISTLSYLSHLFFSPLHALSPLSNIFQPSFEVIDLENKKQKSNSLAKCKYLDRCNI